MKSHDCHGRNSVFFDAVQYTVMSTDLAFCQAGRRRLNIAASERSGRRDERDDSNRLHGEVQGKK
jgi:hypothetical protein